MRLKEDFTEGIFHKRLKIIFLGICVVFGILSVKLFNIQIVNGEKYKEDSVLSVSRTLTVEAPRGNIYDRKGEPLAVNVPSYSIFIDSSVREEYEDRDKILFELFNIIENKYGKVKDDIPVTESLPYKYTLSEVNVKKWLKKRGFSEDMKAEKLMEDIYSSISNEGIFLKSEAEKRRFFTLKEDMTDENAKLIFLICAVEDDGGEIPEAVPIIKTQEGCKFEYASEEKIRTWLKNDLGFEGDDLEMSADEVMEYLTKLFEIPKSIPEDLREKLLSLRYMIYMKRYRKYELVEIEENASKELVAYISENKRLFPGVLIEAESERFYPYGEYFSHVLGYTGKISEKEYEEYKKYGYGKTSVIGKSGIEKAFELELSGKEGKEISKVNALGEAIGKEVELEAEAGGNVFLTLDAKLQKAAYIYLEDALKEVLVSKLKSHEISVKELIISLVECQNVDFDKLSNAREGVSFKVWEKIKAENSASQKPREDILKELIEKGEVSSLDMILVFFEQERLTAEKDYLDKIKKGEVSLISAVLRFMEEKQITPGHTNLDPSSGSVFVSDVKTGKVLVSVSYPSYDSNRLVNDFDSGYYDNLLNNPSTPLVNRPLNERKAPGSSLKMITAVAALEEGLITPEEKIYDEGIFKKAGAPFAKCWIYTNMLKGHGNVNVSEAIEVSCNFFFYELAYRMEGAEDEEKGIKLLNRYMESFGLNEKTGVEIGEALPKMAAAEYKKESVLSKDAESPQWEYMWTAGDSIRAAIGQSLNSFTPAQMTKYISVLANGGDRYKFYMADRIEGKGGKAVNKFEPQKEGSIEIKKENLEAVKYGMYLAGAGQKGTLRNIFSDFDIKVCVKSGTAQEDLERSSHVWCVGFAPYDEPEIAFCVMIPFGDYKTSAAAVTGRRVMEAYFNPEEDEFK